MRIYRSNRLEALSGVLSQVIASENLGPLEPEVIVVQSKGMERWLSHRLSERFGIWANAQFPFPRALVELVFDAVVPAPDSPRAFERDCLTWTIAAVLPALAGRAEFEAIRSYLEGEDSQRKRFELARRIAYSFDQYAVYRPDMLADWEAGAEADWQAILWRTIVERHGATHVAARAARFFEAWRALDDAPNGLPKRISVFGISSLPPLYVEILRALAERIDVRLYCMTPSRKSLDCDERPPSLLVNLGAFGREFEQVLGGSKVDPPAVEHHFVEPGSRTMLTALQSDLLALRSRGPGTTRPPLPVSSEDDTLRVHACHSPMREVEVLRDQLLACFERDPTLEPHDVLVMTPHIDRYASFVDAVFGLAPNEAGYLPYRIADRSIRSDNPTADALLHVLGLLPSRMKASEVLDLLEFEPIRRRFGISAEGPFELGRLVRAAGIRWGIDESHRASEGQPERAENTWRFGLERLLLGYAMEGRGERLFEHTLPVDEVEGEVAENVGQLVDLVETLFAWRERLSAPRSPSDWVLPLVEAQKAWCLPGTGEAHHTRILRRAVFDIASAARLAGFNEEVELETMVNLLEEHLETERTTHDFLSGGITFCAMLPMRSIPFRVVALLGMNDGDFPRPIRAPSFDKMAAAPRAGDRMIREEDRYLFLESILSARERFIVTYVGRGIQDNAEYPPSVVVSELMDAADASFTVDAPGTKQLTLQFEASLPRDPSTLGPDLLVHHPLQPFSPQYFATDSRLFSYSSANAEGARALSETARTRTRFHDEPLLVTELPDTVSLDELTRFFENPARALLQRQLGVFLEEDPLIVEDREPLELHPLDAFVVGSQLLEQSLLGHDPRALVPMIRAQGILPLGALGDVACVNLIPQVRAIAEKAATWCEGKRRPALDVRIEVDGVTLHGALGEVYERAQVRRQFSRVRPKTELSQWIRHLFLQCAPAGATRTTVLVGRPLDPRDSGAAIRVYAPLETNAAQALLSELLRLYRLGHRAPLCLFPAASKQYVEMLKKAPQDRQRALESARRVFTTAAGPDAEDAYVRRLFSGVDPFTEGPAPFDEGGTLGLPSFARAAELVFGPLLEHTSRDGS